MPRDYQKANPTQYQRRPHLTMGHDWIRDFLRRGQIARVAHLSGDQPFITPTNYWFDEERQAIVFHSNLAGRVRSNLEHFPRVCVEVSEVGRLLPANTALEFSIQFRSVMVFGVVGIVEDVDEKRRALYGLIGKYFPKMSAGKDYRPIMDKELAATSVYALAIESWSGKENWAEQAEQADDWPPLSPELLVA